MTYGPSTGILGITRPHDFLENKMAARNISAQAYRAHIQSGKQQSQWMKILTFLNNRYPQCYTRSELASMTGMRMSSVCGRVNELMAAKLVEEKTRRKCAITDEPAHPVTITFLARATI
jgi:hypothetical protein